MDMDAIIEQCHTNLLPLKCYMRNDEEYSDILVFEKGKLYADIEFYDSGYVLAVVSDKEDVPDVWRVDHVGEALEKIKKFFEDES